MKGYKLIEVTKLKRGDIILDFNTPQGPTERAVNGVYSSELEIECEGCSVFWPAHESIWVKE